MSDESAPTPPQLQMLYPESRLAAPPVPRLPEGCMLRQFRDADEADYLAIMDRTDLAHWTAAQFAEQRDTTLPSGFFIVEHDQTGRVVASAMSRHRASAEHPQGGELGWVVADPDHAGKGLGLAVCAAATARLIEIGYRRIFLLTDDFRLPAIKTYLKLGYEPIIHDDAMASRWSAIRKNLAR